MLTGNYSSAFGGGIYNLNGVLSVDDSVLSGNSAPVGGGIFNQGTLTVTGCTLSGNSATDPTRGGGAIANDANRTATVTGSTLTGNSAVNHGGGIDTEGTLTLSNSTLSGNSASYGGGIEVSSSGGVSGTLTVIDCTLSGNSATNAGGGIDNNGTLTVTDSTLFGNSTTNTGGGIDNNGTLTVTDCTLFGNSAANTGGGIFNKGTLTVTDCTVSANFASSGGGLYNASNASGPATLGNTIVAGNTATSGGPDASGAISSQGHNLIGETDGGSGWVGTDLTGTIAQPLNASLAPLGDYGGPTQTMPPLYGSPAIDAGDNSLVPGGITTDQRGQPRTFNGTVDIGAYELQVVLVASLVVDTTADYSDPTDGKTTLREAIASANALLVQTISWDSTLFATAQTITLTGAPLELSNRSGTETITGPAAGVTVSGGGLSRVFQVDRGVTASISGLTITGGMTARNGGGILNDGTLSLTNATVKGNSANHGDYGGGESSMAARSRSSPVRSPAIPPVTPPSAAAPSLSAAMARPRSPAARCTAISPPARAAASGMEVRWRSRTAHWSAIPPPQAAGSSA